MQILKDMVQAIQKDKPLGLKLYHDFNPNANKLPFLTYSVISDVPAIHGDDRELQSRLTVRMHIVTKDGAYYDAYRRLNQIMIDLGFMRVQTVEMIENGLKMKVIDYRIGVDA